MIRAKNLWIVVALVVGLSLGAAAAPVAPWIDMYAAGGTGVWFFTNTTGQTANVLHLEFEQEVTISNSIAFGGGMMVMGPLTGTTFDIAGSLVNNGALQVDLPAGAVPALAQWLTMDAAGNASPLGSPFFSTVAVLGRLFGMGIVAAREADPAGLQAAFNQFFVDNEEYLAGLSESLGMSLADSLMPIILASPAEGIENFFNTIMGMLGVVELSEVVGGGINWGALFMMLGI